MRNSGTVGGNTNLPYKVVDYAGGQTDTATVNVDRENKVISVDVNEEAIQTKLTAGENITIIDGVISSAGNVTEEQLEQVKTALEDQINTKATQADIDEIWDTLDTKLVEYYLRFYWDSDNNKIALSSSVEYWMENSESFDGRLMLISVNNSIPAVCTVNKSITSNVIEIYISFEDFGTIDMQCNKNQTGSENWAINLDRYFPSIYDDSDFVPFLEISNGEVTNDYVINPSWVADFSTRADILRYAPIKAWVGIDDDWEPCTIYGKFSKDDIIICIQTSKGEYKLTYQYQSDPK